MSISSRSDTTCPSSRPIGFVKTTVGQRLSDSSETRAERFMGTTPPLNTLELLRRLIEARVEFVVIGGAAAIAHGSAVTTEDLDVCAPLSNDNAIRIVQALQDLRPLFRMRPDLGVVSADNRHLRLLKNLYLRTDAGQLDVLGELPDVCSYDELLERSVTMNVEGLVCRILDIDTLIAAKRAAGRDKDLITIKHLEAIKREREQNPGLFD
jgi:predicted nucleotidyltransferase